MNTDSSWQPYLPLILIILLGTALRFYGLGDANLWLDEALSWQQATLPLADLLASVAADVHPPLYALLLHFISSVFGDSEWVLRLPSAFFGAASIWLTWAIARHLASEPAALIAALLSALSLFNIQYAQEARMYTLLGCLALLSMLLLLQISTAPASGNSKPATLKLLAYLLTTCLMMYSHVYGLFIVLVQNIFMAARYLPQWPDRPGLSLKRWCSLQLLLGALFIPWLFILAEQLTRVQASFWLRKPYFNALRETFVPYVGSLPALQLALFAVAIALIALLAPAAVRRWPQWLRATGSLAPGLSNNSVALLLGLWLLVPILLPYAVSQFGQSIYLPRYTIASSFALFILVAIGIASLPTGWTRYSLLTLLSILIAGALPFYYLNDTRTDWPAAVRHLEAQAAPNALVLFHNHEILAPYHYYSARDDLRLEAIVPGGIWPPPGSDAKSKPDVRRLARDNPQVWLLSGYDYNTAITEIEIINQIAGTHSLQGGQEFGAVRVFQFTLP